MADLTPPTPAAPAAAPTAAPATSAPRLAHLPHARVKRFPDFLPDSSACRSVLLKYLLSSSPSLEVLGTSETYAVANSVPTAIDYPPPPFSFHTQLDVGINLSTRRLPPRRVLLSAL